jgi:hypothetical protein
VFCAAKIDDHGSCRGNTAQALARWRHQVALHEATNALHWAMPITPYRLGGMANEIIVNLTKFLVTINSMFAYNVS